MKLLRSVCVFVVLWFILSTPASQPVTRSGQQSPSHNAGTTFGLLPPDAGTRARLSENYGQLPLSFEAGQGQADSAAQFLARGSGYQLSLTATTAVLHLRKVKRGTPANAIVSMKLVGANPAAPASGREELPGKSHYFLGNEPARWRTNVSRYAKVEYRNVWPGVNLVYYGNQRQLEYDFVVAAGADPRVIRLAFENADEIKTDPQGRLVLRVGDGAVTMQKPFIWQEVNGARAEVAGGFVLEGTQARFALGRYDDSKPLIVDPVLSYSTYLGGLDDDVPSAIGVDGAGNVYVAGTTLSTNFPVVGPVQPVNRGNQDVFVTKLNASGSAILYSTYLGGSADEGEVSLAVDGAGNAFLTGLTRSANFPVASPFQAASRGNDEAFVTKLNPAGSALVYSTYLGGTGFDTGRGIAVDAAGNAYVTGGAGPGFPTTAGSFQSAWPGASNSFITKFNPAGSALVYSTYLGGSDTDDAADIALDAAGNAYVAGDTSSRNFPTRNPVQATYSGGRDGFVSKLNADGSALVWSTYLGGSRGEDELSIAVDAAGSAVVTGETFSANFPLKNPLQPAIGSGTDAFVTKFDTAGALAWSTYLGGSNSGFNDSDAGRGIAIDAAGNVYVTGYTTSPNFPVANPLQGTNNGGGEAFITKFNPAGSALTFSTFLGGSGYDNGRAIALDAAGNIYVTGQTRSTNFPTRNPVQPTLASSATYDAFIVRIGDDPICPTAPEAVAADSDKLALSNVLPPDGSVVSGASLKIGGLKGTVTWLLQSQNDATLVVRLFDQDGNTRGDAGSMTVTKSTQCPPKESAQDFVFDRSQLDLTPLNGVPVTSLTLSAIMSGRNGGLIKRADVSYRVIPDVIAFDGTPKINGQDAPDGSRLPSNGTINFTSAIKYHLTSDVTGKIRLQAFNASGGGELASKDLSPAVAATAQPTSWNTPLDFQFTVPPNVNEVSIVASLLTESGAVLKSSTPLFYRNKIHILPGAQPQGGTFLPLEGGDHILAGTRIDDLIGGGLALKVTDALPDNLRGSRFIVLLAQRFNDGKLVRGPATVNFVEEDEFPKPSFRLSIGGMIPEDVDKWEFQLLILPPNNAPQIETEIHALLIDRIHIVSVTPATDSRLAAGTKQEFVFRVAYNTTPPRTISAEVTSVLAVVGQRAEIKEFSNGIKAAGASDSTGEEFRFTFDLPPDLIELRVAFFFTNSLQGKPAAWVKFDRPAFRFNAEERQFIKGLGVDVETVENKINRLIAQGRSAQDAKTTVVEGLLKSRVPPTRPESGLAEAAVKTLAASSLLQDFVGLKATWQFDPAIPADGSFSADLKFYYRADDLPDDPNFNEAAMKVIGFDPATGRLESYPTTLDLSAKTATARVNELMPLYSLGLIGPFAHRTLNFPVLRSLDDFTTRLNFASFGNASAGLSARAFTPAGTSYGGTGLVNPLTTMLPAGRALSGLAGEIFKFTAPLEGGWVQTQADKNFIAGYQMLGKGKRLDGLSLPALAAGTQVLTSVQYDATTTTEIHVANVTRFVTNLTLELRTTAGTLAGSSETALAPKEKFANRVQDIFTAMPQPFTGYVVVRGNTDLSAAALQITDTEITALPGQIALVSSTPTKLCAPYVLTDRETITTRLDLVNPTARAANLTIRFAGETGANLAPPVSLPLAAGQQVQQDVAQLFGLSPGDLTYGSLVIDSSISGVVGSLSYYDPAGFFKFRAALPLLSEAAKNFVFAHLDNGESAFTDVGIFNPGAQAARVDVRVLRADGTETGRATVAVPAGAHYSNLLDTIIEASFGQVGGSFTLSSDQPIVAAAAFGPLDGETLSALPGQAFDPSNFARANTSVSAASYQGAGLAADSIVAAFGTELATNVAAASSLPLPTTLAGTTVRVRDSACADRFAPLFFVAPQQVNYQLPPGTATGTATVTITSGAGATSTGTVQITSVAAGLFAANSDGQGPPAGYAVRVKADGTQLNEAFTRFDPAQNKFVLTPLDLGPGGEQVVLVLFGTGFRAVSSVSAVSVKIGGVNAEVLYAGAQGGFVGLDQLNLLVPRALIGRGEAELVLTVDGRPANTVKVHFK